MARSAFGQSGKLGRGKLFGSVGVRLEGNEQLERKLVQMAKRLSSQGLRIGLAKGGEVIRRTAEALAPRASGGPTRSGGHGADRIVMEVTTKGQSNARAEIGAAKSAFWLNIQEVGSLYMPAQPWLAPAFDEERNEAIRVTVAQFRRLIIAGRI